MSSDPKSKQPKSPAKKAAGQRPDDMSAEVLEFITAIDDYKRKQEKPFPSWSEVLDILKNLGYQKKSV